ncbi:MAG: 2-dehydropantoate 2-reductase [Pseudopedobacter saltans]|uniref:2-dehydropantoate 2-reductase n=1 Tax=Pseudopedobacter saltans TaxID=151895 RepID=A0A2W5H036_9SPHI|nr:MAG: 2-dehydropantoate 2-reductase [Pseudopedobacter saltans]
MMNYGIIGSGAIGIFYGTRLVNAGENVHFLLHSDFEYVKQNGFVIDSNTLGNQNLKTIKSYNNTNEMPLCDVVFVCLKTTENARLLPQLLSPILKKETIIILIQNGLGVEKDVADMFPNQQIAGASAFISCNKIGPGHIRHLDHGDIVIGNYNVKNRKRLDDIASIFSSQQVHCSITENLSKLRWRKLIWNIAFNGMTVVLGCQTDKLMHNENLVHLSKQIMEEVILGAKACGVTLNPNLPEEMIQYTTAMQPYSPSMKLDYDYNRPMEIHYIYEVPVAEAKANGYYMSKVDMLAQQLRFLEAQQEK